MEFVLVRIGFGSFGIRSFCSRSKNANSEVVREEKPENNGGLEREIEERENTEEDGGMAE